MTTWEAKLQCDLVRAYSADAVYASLALDAFYRAPRIHLAVMREPWAGYVQTGVKDIESRWSKNQCAPHGQLSVNDLIVWKPTGKDIVGVSCVTTVEGGRLFRGTASIILDRYHARICVPNDPAPYVDKLFYTLAFLGPFMALPAGESVRCEKRDRRGWAIVRGAHA